MMFSPLAMRPALSWAMRRRICAPMRLLPHLILGAGLVLVSASPVLAQSRPAHPPARPAARAPQNAPKPIGKFDEWTAATHAEAGQTVCYAFTRALSSAPALPGRGDVVLTVTQRPSGRDAVAITAGFAYPANAEVMVSVDRTELPFYSGGRSAFARDGHAVTLAFDKGRTVVAKSPGPKGVTVSDTFGLRGFNAAYAAINKACPAK
jgi:hypothetical protein